MRSAASGVCEPFNICRSGKLSLPVSGPPPPRTPAHPRRPRRRNPLTISLPANFTYNMHYALFSIAIFGDFSQWPLRVRDCLIVYENQVELCTMQCSAQTRLINSYIRYLIKTCGINGFDHELTSMA